MDKFQSLSTYTLLFCFMLVPSAYSQQTKETSMAQQAELARELTNPLADLVTITIQMNYDYDIGVNDEGEKLQTNIQPVIPFHISDDWNVISRTIMPVTHQDNIFSDSGSQFGLGDINLSLFFSPIEPGAGGIIWGAGPTMLFPTATDALLGTKKWAAGPAGIILKFQGPWTYGALGNHIWSYAGDDDRVDINNSFIQPFVAYTMENAWTISAQSETTYNWKQEEWSIHVNFAASKLVMFGRLPVRFTGGSGILDRITRYRC